VPSDKSVEKKRRAAEAAVSYIESGMVLGIGTGSTVNQLIEVLKDRKIQLQGAVSSSRQTSEKLKSAGIPELDLNSTGDLSLYIDGADEATADGVLIKGGGALEGEEATIWRRLDRPCVHRTPVFGVGFGGEGGEEGDLAGRMGRVALEYVEIRLAMLRATAAFLCARLFLGQFGLVQFSPA